MNIKRWSYLRVSRLTVRVVEPDPLHWAGRIISVLYKIIEVLFKGKGIVQLFEPSLLTDISYVAGVCGRLTLPVTDTL